MKMRSIFLNTGGKGNPCYIMAESLVKLCPALMWKAEFRSDRLGNLDEEIPKQCRRCSLFTSGFL